MISMGPFALFFLFLGLAAAKVSERLTEQTARRSGIWATGGGLAAALVLETAYRLTDWTPSWISIPFVLIFYIGLFLWFFSLMRRTDIQAEQDRFLAAAALWFALLFLVFLPVPRDYRENIWIVDLTNKALPRALLDLLPVAAENRLAATYALLNQIMARHFLLLTAGFSLALVYFVYRLFSAYFHRQAVPAWYALHPPRRLAWIALGIWTIAAVTHFVQPPWHLAYLLSIAAPFITGAYTFWGAARLREARDHHRMLFPPLLILLFISLILGYGGGYLAALGWLANFAGWSEVEHQATALPARRLERWMPRLMTFKGLIVSFFVFAILSAVFFILSVPFASRSSATVIVATEPAASAPLDMAVLKLNGNGFLIDRYEYPNEAGRIPLTGVTAVEAAERCRATGKRLCTRREWQLACGGARLQAYQFAADAGTNKKILNRRCNRLPFFGAPRGVLPSGAMDCVDDNGVYDLSGNVWEWVTDPADERFVKLMGGSYANNDYQTSHCGFTLQLHPLQLPRLDKSSFGFRCCRDLN